jgi:hypothetical protein
MAAIDAAPSNCPANRQCRMKFALDNRQSTINPQSTLNESAM